MKLNKNSKMGAVALAIVFVAFCIISFVIPFPRTGLFWTGFIFGVIAIIASAVIFAMAFGKGSDAKSRFYGFPIARVGAIYVVIQIIFSIIAMCLAWVPVIPEWPFILVFILMLAAAALGTIAADVVRVEIERQDVQLKKNVTAMQELRSMANGLVSQCDEEEIKAKVKKLAEALRYSDPVSNDATEAFEAELKSIISEIQRAIVDSDNDSVITLCKKAEAVLAERNRLCKLNK